MTEAFAKQIETEARQAMTELVAAAKLKKGDVLVVGCSSSEMVGGHIGKDSSIEAARALYGCWKKKASGWQRSAVST